MYIYTMHYQVGVKNYGLDSLCLFEAVALCRSGQHSLCSLGWAREQNKAVITEGGWYKGGSLVPSVSGRQAPYLKTMEFIGKLGYDS